MARKLPEEFEGKELAPLCLAANIGEASEVEKSLDNADMDYTFDVVDYLPREGALSVLFGSPKGGVMFLVPAKKYEECIALLSASGLSKLLIS